MSENVIECKREGGEECGSRTHWLTERHDNMSPEQILATQATKKVLLRPRHHKLWGRERERA